VKYATRAPSSNADNCQWRRSQSRSVSLLISQNLPSAPRIPIACRHVTSWLLEDIQDTSLHASAPLYSPDVRACVLSTVSVVAIVCRRSIRHSLCMQVLPEPSCIDALGRISFQLCVLLASPVAVLFSSCKYVICQLFGVKGTGGGMRTQACVA